MLTFSWLTLGNSIAAWPQLAQWYEYTGVYGGSLWIVVANALIAYAVLDAQECSPKKTQAIVGMAAWLVMPACFSIYRYSTYTEKASPQTLGIVQPNFDPYSDKFNPDLYNMQLDTLLRLSEKALAPNTKVVFWPETSIPGDVWEGEFANSWQGARMLPWLAKHPRPKLDARVCVSQALHQRCLAIAHGTALYQWVKPQRMVCDIQYCPMGATSRVGASSTTNRNWCWGWKHCPFPHFWANCKAPSSTLVALQNLWAAKKAVMCLRWIAN